MMVSRLELQTSSRSSSILRVQVPRALKPLLSPSRYKGAYGGRGGAKSHFFAEQLLVRCVRQQTRAVCIREVQNSIKESVRQLLVDKIAAYELGGQFEVLETEIRGPHGSLIIFKGMQHYNAESIKSLEGYDIAWVEEAQSLSATSLKMLRPTIRKDNSELWFSWNPKHETDPIDQFLRSKTPPPNSIVVKVGWQDNPWFPDVLKGEKDHDYATNKLQAEHIWGGAYEIIAEGAYFGEEMLAAENGGRICALPIEPTIPVNTGWDIGIDDATAIWFFQDVGRERHIIDYMELSGAGLPIIAKKLDEKGYRWGTHILPHDAAATEKGPGRSYSAQFQEFGFRNVEIVPRTQDLLGDVTKTRLMIPKCVFDKTRCEQGIKALRNYRREWDEKRLTWRERPLHDWTSHAADAFRQIACSHISIVKPSAWPAPDTKWIV